MGHHSKIKKILHRKPENTHTLVDLCSGNALVPVLSQHLFPQLYESFAIDKLKRERNWNKTKNFHYLTSDIYKLNLSKIPKPIILTGVHCCKNLAERVVEIYNETPKIKHLILMPCCSGALSNGILQFIKSQSSNDTAWALKLALQCDGKVKMYKDNHVLSPRNHIIMASKPKHFPPSN